MIIFAQALPPEPMGAVTERLGVAGVIVIGSYLLTKYFMGVVKELQQRNNDLSDRFAKVVETMTVAVQNVTSVLQTVSAEQQRMQATMMAVQGTMTAAIDKLSVAVDHMQERRMHQRPEV